MADQTMRIVIGADYKGYARKEEIKAWLTEEGHVVDDVGTHTNNEGDFPVYASLVGRAVAADPDARGIVVCESGVGVAIAANKVPGVRAVLATQPEIVEHARRSDDVNVLAIASLFTDAARARAITTAFLETPYDALPRRDRRLAQIAALERGEELSV